MRCQALSACGRKPPHNALTHLHTSNRVYNCYGKAPQPVKLQPSKIAEHCAHSVLRGARCLTPSDASGFVHSEPPERLHTGA
eukprot:6441229-Alexandrium_andersonii.AAC.1